MSNTKDSPEVIEAAQMGFDLLRPILFGHLPDSHSSTATLGLIYLNIMDDVFNEETVEDFFKDVPEGEFKLATNQSIVGTNCEIELKLSIKEKSDDRYH